MKDDRNAKNSGETDIGDMIKAFKGMVDNPLSRFILQRALTYCKKDDINRLENGLNIYLGEKKEACYKCKLLSKFIAYVIKKGAVSFGVTEEELKNQMKDPYWVRGLTSVLKGIAVFGVSKPFVPGSPFQIVWNITKACNMKCAHCYENAGKKSEKELNFDEVIKGLDILAKSGVTSVAFSGGEPTIHPNILEFIDYAGKKGMCVAMATNGYTLSNKSKCQEFADAGLEFVQISLDGIDPETHNSFRGVNGAWNKAVEAVKNSVEAGFFVEVATTATEHNYKEIPEMISFIRNIGADWFMIYNFIPTGKGANIVNMDISPKKRRELLEVAYAENANGKMQILSTAPQYAMIAESLVSKDSQMIPTHFYNPEYTNQSIIQLSDFIGGCGAGRFYMSIEPNGDMYPCVFFPHETKTKLGKLLEDNFEDIWRNNKLLKELRDKSILKGHCGECKSRNICGGCRARAYNYFKDILAPDPGCVNNEDEWNRIRAKILNKGAEEVHQGDLFLDLRESGA